MSTETTAIYVEVYEPNHQNTTMGCPTIRMECKDRESVYLFHNEEIVLEYIGTIDMETP